MPTPCSIKGCPDPAFRVVEVKALSLWLPLCRGHLDNWESTGRPDKDSHLKPGEYAKSGGGTRFVGTARVGQAARLGLLHLPRRQIRLPVTKSNRHLFKKGMSVFVDKGTRPGGGTIRDWSERGVLYESDYGPADEYLIEGELVSERAGWVPWENLTDLFFKAETVRRSSSVGGAELVGFPGEEGYATQDANGQWTAHYRWDDHCCFESRVAAMAWINKRRENR